MNADIIELKPEDMVSRERLISRGLTPDEADEFMRHQQEHDDPQRGDPHPDDYRS